MASQSMMDVSSDEHTESDARVQIQEIIEDLKRKSVFTICFCFGQDL